MPLIMQLESVAVSGSLVEVVARQLRGIGPIRATVKNSGANALTAAKVQVGPDVDNVADLDTAVFATLAPAAVAQLLIAAPVDGLKIVATCVAGTTLDISLTDGVAN